MRGDDHARRQHSVADEHARRAPAHHQGEGQAARPRADRRQGRARRDGDERQACAGHGRRCAGQAAGQGPRAEDRLQPRASSETAGSTSAAATPATASSPATCTAKTYLDDCRVESGTLADPYTGERIRYTRGGASEVDIDHVVALSDAWQKGAQQQAPATRVAFANDPLELLAVDAHTNRSKGDGDAATWLPPNKAFRCAYVARQVAVKTKYKLWVTQAEKDAIGRVLATCPGQKLPAARRAHPGDRHAHAACADRHPQPRHHQRQERDGRGTRVRQLHRGARRRCDADSARHP